jgi:FAD/FMN-containing dehydrogenase
MNRRRLLQAFLAAISFLPTIGLSTLGPVLARGKARSRIRPGDPAWPQEASWQRLDAQLGGRLQKVRSPLDACLKMPGSADCGQLFKNLKNPYYLGDEAGLTQSLGWVGGWTSRPSVYAVAAQTTEDVVAAVNFARENNLRLVVKGGGHSYQGTSNAPDSLLLWMRPMKAITLHDDFIGAGCPAGQEPQPAVSVEAGAIWGQIYDAVTTKAGRYVQGGGCMTVGVAGLILSGGFGSFSKAYGMAAASLLEAEIVTADGAVKICNACSNPELFWGIKGGGGGSLGVVTRLTLRTHSLPEHFGAVFATVKAASDEAFRRLIERILAFYAETLFNPHWGEQLRFQRGNVLDIAMVFQDLDQPQAEALWRPFFDWIAASPQDFSLASGPAILALPARRFWDPAFMKEIPGVVLFDDRPGASEANVFWAGNREEAGQVLHAYQSAWLPAALLEKTQQSKLAAALFAASRHWRISLHLNKGLAGAPAKAIEAARDTATNPAVLDAFALAISGAQEAPAYPGIAGHEPDLATATRHAEAVDMAMGEIRKLVPAPGSYVSESDFFHPSWHQAFWGINYPRLLALKEAVDPDGLFFVHHGVGSEGWSADGFTRSG